MTGMTQWKEIACARGCESHDAELVHVILDGPTPYHDYPPIPHRLACEFDMTIWKQPDPMIDPQGRYCPAADVVSQTIRDLGVWEPTETIVILDLIKRNPDNCFVDMGAQIGWFSILAQVHDMGVICWEADPEVAAVLRVNLHAYEAAQVVKNERIAGDSEVWKWGYRKRDPQHLTVKIDVEGAEPDAIAILDYCFERELVDYVLIEMSPVFGPQYPALTRQIMGHGMQMGILPDKSTPPAKLDDISDLEWVTSASKAANWIDEQRQTNVLFARKELL